MTKAWLGLLLWCVAAAHAADMTVVHYVDQDPGGPPYVTRILVTPDFLRMDNGEDDGDFVLLDRQRHVVTNVIRASGLAMVFSPGVPPSPPKGWNAHVDTFDGPRGTRRFRLMVNGETCSEGIAAQAAAPDAARAMAELKSALAVTQYRAWQETPPELQHDCDLANLVWEADATLSLGLPLEEREFTGRSRRFQQQSAQPLSPGLFRVPDGLKKVDAPS